MNSLKLSHADYAPQKGPLKQPAWIHNPISDDVWYLREYLDGEHRSRLTVSWIPQTKDRDFSADLRWGYWKDLGKKIAFTLMESPSRQPYKSGSLALICREIRALCEWFCYSLNAMNFERITRTDLDRYLDYLGEKNLCETTVEQKLSTLTLFWKYREALGDGLTFEPFPSYAACRRASRKLGHEAGHTPTILPNDLYKIIEFCLEQFENSSTTLQKLKLFCSYGEGDGKRGRKFKASTGQTLTAFIDDVQTLYASAIAIILALIAERKHELALTRYSDVMLLLSSDEDILYGFESKTSGSESFKSTARPVTPRLKQAFDIITRLTEFQRSKSGSENLLLALPFVNSSRNDRDLNVGMLYRLLDHLSVKIGVTDTIRPHMFRRAYALLFFWQYELGDLYPLSRILQHNCVEYTKKYLVAPDLTALLSEDVSSWLYDAMSKAYENSSITKSIKNNVKN
jgi:integrase